MRVAFTGHRPNKLGGYKEDNPIKIAVTKRLAEALRELQATEAISGMALGVDQWAADVCIELKIPFIAAVPFIGQERIWPPQSKDKFNALLAEAKETVIVSPGEYAAWKLQKRNEWMVDHCDTLIAVWDETDGGTKNCVDYAKKVGRELISYQS